MHPNPLFRVNGSDAEQRALMEALVQEIGIGMVFAQTPNGPRVAHAALFSTGDGAVQFHIARGNGLSKIACWHQRPDRGQWPRCLCQPRLV